MSFRILAERSAICAAEQKIRLQHHGAEYAVRVRRRIANLGVDQQTVRMRIFEHLHARASYIQFSHAIGAIEPFDPVLRAECYYQFLEFHISFS